MVHAADEKIRIRVTGRIVRIARLETEYFESLEAPVEFIEGLRRRGARADIFTFMQAVPDTEPRYDYRCVPDSLAVISVTTYEQWWKNQIKDKTRNMVRRAQKAGILVRRVEFSDDLVKGIKDIYDESRLRQGIPFKHYGKDLETLRKAHATFLDRSDFFGAFDGDELIGFIKLVHSKGFSSLMQIVSKMASRDKAPTNALIAKAVETCVEKGIPLLMYGVWSQRGLGDFKRHHAFKRHDVPRYFVPLTAWGRFSLKLGWHRSLKERIPESWTEFAVNLKKRWYAFRYRPRA
jgi:hypothetical protein